MILGEDGAVAGTFKIGPYFPEEVLYVQDHIVKDMLELQPGTYDWIFEEGQLKVIGP